jgi:hypothetical protein
VCSPLHRTSADRRTRWPEIETVHSSNPNRYCPNQRRTRICLTQNPRRRREPTKFPPRRRHYWTLRDRPSRHKVLIQRAQHDAWVQVNRWRESLPQTVTQRTTPTAMRGAAHPADHGEKFRCLQRSLVMATPSCMLHVQPWSPRSTRQGWFATVGGDLRRWPSLTHTPSRLFLSLSFSVSRHLWWWSEAVEQEAGLGFVGHGDGATATAESGAQQWRHGRDLGGNHVRVNRSTTRVPGEYGEVVVVSCVGAYRLTRSRHGSGVRGTIYAADPTNAGELCAFCWRWKINWPRGPICLSPWNEKGLRRPRRQTSWAHRSAPTCGSHARVSWAERRKRGGLEFGFAAQPRLISFFFSLSYFKPKIWIKFLWRICTQILNVWFEHTIVE